MAEIATAAAGVYAVDAANAAAEGEREPPAAVAPQPAPTAGDDDGYDSNMELAEEQDDGQAPPTVPGWSKDNDFAIPQRTKSQATGRDGPRLNLPDYETKGIYEYAKLFLPKEYFKELSKAMAANGAKRYNAGKGDIHYKNWTVTEDDVHQWIGVWMYMLAFPQHGSRETYFQPPKGGFGPAHDLKAWLKAGQPQSGDRGIRWFNQMQACFELPTYGRANDKFNRTRRFWEALRDAFFAAAVCSWIMCLDESMIKWLGRGMPGFMCVLRKPTPKGLELHTLCCAICGILIWFEVYEGKEAMSTKEYCAMYAKSVALTLRMVKKFATAGIGRVVVADSWFGSVACALALFKIGIFCVMNVKTGHTNFPKQTMLNELGYDAKTGFCPKDTRGQHTGWVQDFTVGTKTCTLLAAGLNQKKPMLLVSTAGTLMAVEDYVKHWTVQDEQGNISTLVTRHAMTEVHGLFHEYFHIVDDHNQLRQGQVSMADVWETRDWAHRHFAEGLGLWEVLSSLAYMHVYMRTLHDMYMT